MLRRRAAVNLAAPDATRHPLAARAAAVEAVLSPGDAVFFPPRWLHHTESRGSDAGAGGRGTCVSLTFRLRAAAGEGVDDGE